MKLSKICITPQPRGVGGMVSFYAKLVKELALHGIETTSILDDPHINGILVIGGTRNIAGLRLASKRGIRIIQRLNGMNWVHRKRWTGIRHFLRAEIGNLILAFIRKNIADAIVYQSRFSQEWWQRVHGNISKESAIVYNGVDLQSYSPIESIAPPEDRFRILLVEGTLSGGYESGLSNAVRFVEGVKEYTQTPVEMMVVGRVSKEIRTIWEKKSSIPIVWSGLVPQEKIAEIDNSAHILYAADINSACPNSVIESLACGLPVAAFDTGALSELVVKGTGKIVAYGGNPWQLDEPDIHSLVHASVDILYEQSLFRKTAREHAEDAFGIDMMTQSYLDILGET